MEKKLLNNEIVAELEFSPREIDLLAQYYCEYGYFSLIQAVARLKEKKLEEDDEIKLLMECIKKSPAFIIFKEK